MKRWSMIKMNAYRYRIEPALIRRFPFLIDGHLELYSQWDRLSLCLKRIEHVLASGKRQPSRYLLPSLAAVKPQLQ